MAEIYKTSQHQLTVLWHQRSVNTLFYFIIRLAYIFILVFIILYSTLIYTLILSTSSHYFIYSLSLSLIISYSLIL